MKKILSFSLLCTLLVGLLVSSAYSQDANAIIEKILDAQGGRKLLESIKDSTATADMDLPEMGMSGVPSAMPENVAQVFRNSAFGNAAFLAPEKYGISYKLKGKETIDGKEYLSLERTYPDKYTITYYIDPDSYLIYKQRQISFNEMLMEVVEETIYSDYKKVEGIMTPHSLTIKREGVEFAVMTITEVKFNTGLEDSLFKINQ